MQIPIFQVDAFADRLFSGNPAAVCPLEEWLSDDLMLSIAAENNLADTAFFTMGAGGYEIRWFTPTAEVNLCGHATLATAAVIFDRLSFERDIITFQSRSGPLKVSKLGDKLQLDFPANKPEPIATPAGLAQALGTEIRECLAADDLIVVIDNRKQLQQLQPDFAQLKKLPYRGVIVTAPAGTDSELDFACRFFAPQLGFDEDPVTGSAYTELAPYWAERLDKPTLKAHQDSARGGHLDIILNGERVLIAGSAQHYLQGVIEVGNS